MDARAVERPTPVGQGDAEGAARPVSLTVRFDLAVMGLDECVTTVSRELGTMEIVAGLLIALRPGWPRASAVGSALAVVLFLGTLSFLFTTPGVVATHAAGVPVLSAQPGQFLLKDMVLTGVAIWMLGDSLCGTRVRSTTSHQV